MTQYQEHILALESLCTIAEKHPRIKAISLSGDGLVALELFEAAPREVKTTPPRKDVSPPRPQSKRELIAAMRRAKAGFADGEPEPQPEDAE